MSRNLIITVPLTVAVNESWPDALGAQPEDLGTALANTLRAHMTQDERVVAYGPFRVAEQG